MLSPLQNSVVLTNLFEVCPPADLAKFRLVCKEWRDLSLKTWRKSSALKLELNPDDGRFYIGGGTPLLAFLKYAEDPGNECGVKPFRRIKMDGWPKQELDRLWTLVGSYLTSLHLENCRFPDADELWKLCYVICPNLSRLCLRHCSFSSGQNVDEPQLEYKEPVRGKHGHLKSLVIYSSELPVSWLELLSHFQSLTSLEVNADSPSVSQSLVNAIAVIRKQKHDGDGNKLPLPIKHFDVGPFRISYDSVSHHQFDLLRDMELPLKSLVVQTHPDLDLEVVGAILERHSGTLENLDLDGWPISRRGRTMEGNFPCPAQLEKLQVLRIENVCETGTAILKSVPNLQSLFIGGDHDEDTLAELVDWQADNTGVALLPKLRKLTLGSFVGTENLLALAKLMPSIEDLDIMLLDNDEFSTVCDNWKGLKELTVEAYEQECADFLTDKGLTGGSLQIEKPEMKWVHKAVRPNITDLKELRSFSCRSNKLTEVSVYHGFMQLPNLQTLELSSKYATSSNDDDDDEPYHFGEEARNDLREKGIKLSSTEDFME